MLTKLIILLNALANMLSGVVLAPVAWLPGWLSLSLISAVTGALMLLIFKYTSNQTAIKQIRNQIKANILALSLYRDSVAVSLRAQCRILSSALKLMFYSLIPMLVMMVPTILLLGQLAVWYQARPLQTGEEAVITVQLAEDKSALLHELQLAECSGIQPGTGPVRVPSKQMICWNVTAAETGKHTLTFSSPARQFTKELVVGNGYQRTSIRRPAEDWSELLLHPWESPFPPDSVVQSIEVTYPTRSAWTSGTATWLPFWFVVSMIAAFAAKPFLNVHI